VGVVWGGFFIGRVSGRTTTQNQLGLSVFGYRDNDHHHNLGTPHSNTTSSCEQQYCAIGYIKQGQMSLSDLLFDSIVVGQ
jgi:hypothetical protein